MYSLKLSEAEYSLLRGALVMAAEKFDQNAREIRVLKPQLEADEAAGSTLGIIHSSACDSLAEQFDQQAVDTRALIEKLDVAEEG